MKRLINRSKETLRRTEEELSTYEQEQKSLQESIRHHEKLHSIKTQILNHQRLSDDLKYEQWVENFPPDAKSRYDDYKSEELKFKEQKNMHLARIDDCSWKKNRFKSK